MGSPLAAAAGNGEEAALAYVFKAREAVEAPSEFEQRAMMRSCTDIHEVTHLKLLNSILHNPTRQACSSTFQYDGCLHPVIAVMAQMLLPLIDVSCGVLKCPVSSNTEEKFSDMIWHAWKTFNLLSTEERVTGRQSLCPHSCRGRSRGMCILRRS